MWSEMGKQTAQAKEVYSNSSRIEGEQAKAEDAFSLNIVIFFLCS